MFHYVADRISRRTADPLPDTASTGSTPLKRSVSTDVSRPDPSPIAADDVPPETAEEASVDIGVLEAASAPAGTGRRLQATSCPTGYLDCRNNQEFINSTSTGQSCYEACDDGKECCTELTSCKYTTACIEKNSANPNCDGYNSC